MLAETEKQLRTWDSYLASDAGRAFVSRRLPAGAGLLLITLRDGRCALLARPATGTPQVWTRDDDVASPRRLDPCGDAELPALAWLADRGSRSRALRGIVDRVDECRLVAYHPGRRAVLEVRGAASSGKEIRVWIKALRRSAYARVSRQATAIRGVTAPLALSLPLAADDEARALVFADAPGRSLHDRLFRGGHGSADPLLDACRALAAVELGDDARAHGLEEERRATLTMLDRGAIVLPALAELARVARELHLPELPTPGVDAPAGLWGTVHRDLHDKQIFLHRSKVFLIDLDGLARGLPFVDRVNLAEHLRLRALQGGDASANEIANRVDALASRPWPLLSSIARFLVLARLAGVYACRPDQRRLVPHLASGARRALEFTR